MQTPKQTTVTETLAQISQFFAVHTKQDDARQVTCARCGGEIRRVRAYMSLHDQQFGDACIGPGRAWRMEIPYCIACETPPSLYGCIHMSAADLNLPSVLDASRPFGIPNPASR
jgi:hypothetical protein